VEALLSEVVRTSAVLLRPHRRDSIGGCLFMKKSWRNKNRQLLKYKYIGFCFLLIKHSQYYRAVPSVTSLPILHFLTYTRYKNCTGNMLFNTITVSSLFVASALAVASPAPYKLGSMSFNNAFGLNKRQAGYQPTQTYCSPGDTCAEACGATYEQCVSSDGDLHCYDPTIKQSCCPVSSLTFSRHATLD